MTRRSQPQYVSCSVVKEVEIQCDILQPPKRQKRKASDVLEVGSDSSDSSAYEILEGLPTSAKDGGNTSKSESSKSKKSASGKYKRPSVSCPPCQYYEDRGD